MKIIKKGFPITRRKTEKSESVNIPSNATLAFVTDPEQIYSEKELHQLILDELEKKRQHLQGIIEDQDSSEERKKIVDDAELYLEMMETKPEEFYKVYRVIVYEDIIKRRRNDWVAPVRSLMNNYPKLKYKLVNPDRFPEETLDAHNVKKYGIYDIYDIVSKTIRGIEKANGKNHDKSFNELSTTNIRMAGYFVKGRLVIEFLTLLGPAYIEIFAINENNNTVRLTGLSDVRDTGN